MFYICTFIITELDFLEWLLGHWQYDALLDICCIIFNIFFLLFTKILLAINFLETLLCLYWDKSETKWSVLYENHLL